MADTPAGERPSIRPSLRALRSESVTALLDRPLEDEGKVLDALLAGLSAGEPMRELFARLHDAALGQERVANLAAAYERVSKEGRIRLLPKAKQAEFLLAASRFFGDFASDIDASLAFAERAAHLAPDDEQIFDQLETLLASAQEGIRLAKLYSDAAARSKDPKDELRLLRAAVELLEAYSGGADDIVKLHRRIFELDAEDRSSFETLERAFTSARRFRDLAELLEQVIKRAPDVSDEARFRLIGLYRGELRDPGKAVPLVETLLSRDAIEPAALQAAEALVDHRPSAARVAPLLSDSYRRLGRLEDEASALSLELKLARPPRLAEVHRRLATLRQDVLGDPAGALELLEPLVARDPSDVDLRRRYLEVSTTFHREVEAAKLLARSVANSKDVEVRAAVALDIAGLYGKHGDVRRARAALEPFAFEPNVPDAQRLALVSRLVELHQDGADPKALARALEVVIRLEPDLSARIGAAKRLAELCQGSVDDPALAVAAWRALASSPRVEEALDRLETLFTSMGDDTGLVEVLLQRAARAEDRDKKRAFAFRAAELRAAHAPDRARAIEAFREVLGEFGPSRDALAKLSTLLEQQRDWRELALVLSLLAEHAPPAERAAVLSRLSKVRLEELRDPLGALEALRAALGLDPREPYARRLAEKMMSEGDHRLDALTVLEPVYRGEGSHAGIVRVLETRASLASDPTSRLVDLDEAYVILEQHVPDPRRLLDVAGRGLAEAAHGRWAEVPWWLERFRAAALRAGDPMRRAELLGAAMKDVSIDRGVAAELAREAAEAAVAAGDVARGIGIYRALLAFEPSSPELLGRLDELLAEQGNPEERLALYRAALERASDDARRRDLLYSIARIEKDLGDQRASAATLTALVALAPDDFAAHEALVEALSALGDADSLITELRRASELASGERRAPLLLRLARAEAESGERRAALEHYRALFEIDQLPPAAFDELAELAVALGDRDTQVAVLERHVERATDAAEQIRALERLGDARQDRDPMAAAEALRRAARLSRDVDQTRASTIRLYERVLAVDPEDRDAARFLFEAYGAVGDHAGARRVFSGLLSGEAALEAVDLLIALADGALAAGAVSEIVGMAKDALASPSPDVARRGRELMALCARAVSSSEETKAAAPAAFRTLIETYGEPADAETFRRFLEQEDTGVVPAAERRWLFDWRVEHAVDKAPVLVEWADAEERTLRDPTRAAEVYELALAADPAHAEALGALFRLEIAAGRAKRLLGVLEATSQRLAKEDSTEIELRTASLLIEHLGRAEEGYPLLEAVLARTPDHPEAVRIARAALGTPAARVAFSTLLEGAATAAEGAAGQELLSALLDETRGAPELAVQRARWHARLLDHLASDPARALATAVAAAEESPDHDGLWDAAERFARKVGEPKSVADAYARTLDKPLGAALGEAIGRRMVEFHEEWFDEPAAVEHLLERVLTISPRARWALDRIKLSYNAEARWDDLFALYDRAIEGAIDDRERDDLLDEAALAAKDLANDQARAITYLERLYARRQEPRIESMLERLYDRTGRARELIGLLERRTSALAGRELGRVERRLARLWLSLGDVKTAFDLIESALSRDADEPEAFELLEQLVRTPSKVPPPSGRRGKKKASPDVRHDAVRLLEARFRSAADHAGLARTLEAAAELATTTAERIARLEDLHTLYHDSLGEPERAFGRLMALVELSPANASYRERLAELARRLHTEERAATHLVTVAEAAAPAVSLSLLCEAGQILVSIGKPDDAKAAFFRAFDVCRGDDPATLEVARAVEPVLAALSLPRERCDVLERIVAIERDPARRREALGAVGRIAFDELGDIDRAALAYRARVADDPGDREALDGLERVFASAGMHAELVAVLDARAHLVGSEAARADRVRIARLYAEQIRDASAAVEVWRKIRADFGPDEESFAALSALLESAARWDELAALLEEAASALSQEPLRVSLQRALGDLHRDRTGKPVAAVEAYVRAGDFERTVTVGEVVADRQLAITVASRLLELAVEAWPFADADREPSVSRAASFAIETLVRRYLEAGEGERVVETELRGASLPFERAQKRRLKRDAAWTTCDRLERPEQAIRILEELFAEDPADEVAASSVTRFARLLSEAGRKADLAGLWERQARCRAEAQDRPSAVLLWARAGGIWESEISDVDRAVAAYRQGAAIGGEASLEALARIYSERKSWRAAATALEWLSAQSTREDLAERVLRLADSYLALGEWERAQARLEHAAATAIDASVVRRKLAELYRKHAEWGKLADLLVAEAEKSADDRTRLSLLREAASLHSSERADPASAVPLLERAVEIDPEEPALRLSLSDALRASGRYDDAAAVLRAQIERYGHRRPKDRALVHLYLARVSLTRGSRADALAELELGAKINPSHPGILYELGRVAFEEGKLARAESTYRALLLVLRKPDGDPEEAPTRAEIYLDLSDIAALQESPERAGELVESAFEAALDSPADAFALERALKKSGRLELLARAIESRVRAAPSPASAARALSDLVLLHAERVPDGPKSVAAPRIGKEAAHIYRDLEEAQVHDPEAWASLTLVYEWLSDPVGEAKALEHRVEGLLRSEGPLDVDPVLRLARHRLAVPDQRDEGVSLVERALRAGADSSRAWELLSEPVVAGAGHAGVLGLLERIAREPGRERAFVEVAGLAARAGTLSAASLREAAELARGLGNEPGRVALLAAAMENAAASYGDPDRAFVYEELAHVRAREARFDAAADLFERAADARQGRHGRALAIDAARLAADELSDLPRAVRLYSRVLEADPANRAAWEPLLEVYRRMGARSKIIALIESTAPLVDGAHDRSRLRFEEATLMLEEPARLDEAVALLERIVEEDTAMTAAADLLATLLERQGRLGELIALVANQVDLARTKGDPQGVEAALLKFGALLERGGERERALAAYSSVLDWNASCREALRAVVRLEDLPGRQGELADAVERLVSIEEPEQRGPLATRLVSLREGQGDPARIEQALQTACAANPLDGSLRERLLSRYTARGEWGRVAEVLFNAFQAEPGDLPLLLRAAEAYERSGDPERAAAALSTYGDDTDQPDLHLERARIFVLLGAPGAAIDAFRAAYAAGARPNDLIEAIGAAAKSAEGDAGADYTLNLVDVLESVGETAQAREHLGRLLKEQPRHRDALRKLASICAAEARWDETASTYRRLIPLEEGEYLVGAAMNLADACEQSDRLSDARGGLERALVALPENAELRARLRQIYERTGATRELSELLVREARGEVDKTVRAQLLTRAAELLLERNESSKAIAVLEDVRQESPDNILGAVLYARALAETGRPQEAMQTLEAVIAVHRGRRHRDLSLVHREISNIHLEAGDLSKALDALIKAFELDMRNGDLAMQLGHLAIDVDDKETASKALRAVTMMKLRQPGGTEGASAESKAVAYYHLSRIAQAEGDIRKARLMASKAVAENPAHVEAQELLRQLKTA